MVGEYPIQGLNIHVHKEPTELFARLRHQKSDNGDYGKSLAHWPVPFPLDAVWVAANPDNVGLLLVCGHKPCRIRL